MSTDHNEGVDDSTMKLESRLRLALQDAANAADEGYAFDTNLVRRLAGIAFDALDGMGRFEHDVNLRLQVLEQQMKDLQGLAGPSIAKDLPTSSEVDNAPDLAVLALERLDLVWPGATLPQARKAIVAMVLTAIDVETNARRRDRR